LLFFLQDLTDFIFIRIIRYNPFHQRFYRFNKSHIRELHLNGASPLQFNQGAKAGNQNLPFPQYPICPIFAKILNSSFLIFN
jgi:hypothetical protein